MCVYVCGRACIASHAPRTGQKFLGTLFDDGLGWGIFSESKGAGRVRSMQRQHGQAFRSIVVRLRSIDRASLPAAAPGCLWTASDVGFSALKEIKGPGLRGRPGVHIVPPFSTTPQPQPQHQHRASLRTNPIDPASFPINRHRYSATAEEETGAARA